MALNLKKIWIWNGQLRIVDTLFINIDHIIVVEEHTSDPAFDPSGIFLSLDGTGPIFGLTVWSITMSSGRQIHVPVPWNYKSNIWEQLQIECPN
jgi:hypothetical protein